MKSGDHRTPARPKKVGPDSGDGLIGSKSRGRRAGLQSPLNPVGSPKDRSPDLFCPTAGRAKPADTFCLPSPCPRELRGESSSPLIRGATSETEATTAGRRLTVGWNDLQGGRDHLDRDGLVQER